MKVKVTISSLLKEQVDILIEASEEIDRVIELDLSLTEEVALLRVQKKIIKEAYQKIETLVSHGKKLLDFLKLLTLIERKKSCQIYIQ